MTDDTAAKRASWQTWAVTLVVAAGFIAFRLYRPGGAMADAAAESSMTPRMDSLSKEMLAALKPIGAAAICLAEAGANPRLEQAAVDFNRRNKAAMDLLLADVTAAGGMTSAQRDLLDRRAYQDARQLVGSGTNRDAVCNALAGRLDAGEWDLQATTRR